jgi:hypothetical protein
VVTFRIGSGAQPGLVAVNRSPEPWKWVFCICLAVTLLLALIIVTPRGWIQALFEPYALRHPPRRYGRPQLRLLPVPIVVSVQQSLAQDKAGEETIPDTAPPPVWWVDAWQAHLQLETERLFSPMAHDTVLALTTTLLAFPSVEQLLATPDTSLAARLELLKLRNREQFVRLKSLWWHQGWSRRYDRISNQTARLFDEFLYEEIEVPDGDR